VFEAGSAGSSLSHLDLEGSTALGIEVAANSSGASSSVSTSRSRRATRSASWWRPTAHRSSTTSCPGPASASASMATHTGASGPANGLTTNRITMCGPGTVAVLVDGGANNWIGPGNHLVGSQAVVVRGPKAEGNAVTGTVIGRLDGDLCPTGIDVGVIITDGATANGVYDNEFKGPLAVPITIETRHRLSSKATGRPLVHQ